MTIDENNISFIYGGKQDVTNCLNTLLKASLRNSLIMMISHFPNLIRETFNYLLPIE